LAEEIDKADICLGIFGATDKANRVCPLKLYSYMSVGRAVITADTDWCRSIDAKVFRTLEPNNAELLAKEIEQLALDSEERSNLAKAGQDYYRDNLCNEIGTRKLVDIIVE
jgi:glycosyltransferase involved in cell wall biosynthesis